MSEALKPCPWCKSDETRVEYFTCGSMVICDDCAACGPMTEDGIERWNAAPRPSSHPPVADRIRAVADDVTDHRWRNTLRKLADDVEGEGEECGP